MTAETDYDMRIQQAVRRAVVGLSIDDWGVDPWIFNHRVRFAAQLTLLDLSPEDLLHLPNAHGHMQVFYRVLDTVEQKVGGRDIALAHLIVAMYYEVRSQPTVPPRGMILYRKA